MPAISNKKPLLGMYTQTVSKGHHFSLMDESGRCGFHYNLTLDLQNLSAVGEKARENGGAAAVAWVSVRLECVYIESTASLLYH